MKATKILKRRIIIETISLIFLVFCIIYSLVSLSNNKNPEVENINNFIAVVDDKKYNPELKILSDGEGISEEGIVYSVTNNNPTDKSYNILIKTELNKEQINNIKISVDDIYIFNLKDLDQKDGYYLLFSSTLKAGYTKRHVIKSWYNLNTENIVNKKINYIFKLDTN